MSRLAEIFANTPKALISYITAGDPDLPTSLSLMHALANNGTDIIELGVPFSDPMADGAVIQRAAQRAVDKGVSLQNVLDLVAQFREKNKKTPVILMGYLNPIYRMGYETFATKAKAADIDGVLTVDCPVDEIDDFSCSLKPFDIANIFLIAPTTSEERIQKIAHIAQGFIYYVSLKGVTGSKALNVAEVKQRVEIIKKYTDLPIAVGFGIKNPDDAKAVAQCADAVVVGSRFVQTIEENGENAIAAVGKLSGSLKAAIK
ncbi:MAG: tryptophan synthase subunit alpha [Neisseriaceae bacterium]|nr:tryptophan synthase subunit alpha [Neisseriaceae bacterium]